MDPAEIFEKLTNVAMEREFTNSRGSTYQLSAQLRDGSYRVLMHHGPSGHGWGGYMSAAEIHEIENV